MRHSDAEIERAAERFEQLANELDPETARVERADDLQEIAAASEAVRADEARLHEAVESARGRGRPGMRWSGSPGESHPRAPTDPYVTVSRHTALVVLIIEGPVSPRPSGRSTEGCARWRLSSPG
jgi:hypothetical protein